jgi:chemotaxis protein CheD
MATRNISRPLAAPAGLIFCSDPGMLGSKELASVYLLPGEMHASAEPCRITTILGSCVTVCLFDPQTHIGGMNHYILPAWREGQGSSTRFGDLAIASLLAQLLHFGCSQRNLIAKLFGGSARLQQQRPYAETLGAMNVAIARELLASASIPIVAEDTGGIPGRKIIFSTEDGSVWSRRI